MVILFRACLTGLLITNLRSGQGQSELQKQKVIDMESKLKAENKRKQLERQELERRFQLQNQEIETRQANEEQVRKAAIEKAYDDAVRLNVGEEGPRMGGNLVLSSSEGLMEGVDDTELAALTTEGEEQNLLSHYQQMYVMKRKVKWKRIWSLYLGPELISLQQ